MKAREHRSPAVVPGAAFLRTPHYRADPGSPTTATPSKYFDVQFTDLQRQLLSLLGNAEDLARKPNEYKTITTPACSPLARWHDARAMRGRILSGVRLA